MFAEKRRNICENLPQRRADIKRQVHSQFVSFQQVVQQSSTVQYTS
jgi:hypothetical protein